MNTTTSDRWDVSRQRPRVSIGVPTAPEGRGFSLSPRAPPSIHAGQKPLGSKEQSFKPLGNACRRVDAPYARHGPSMVRETGRPLAENEVSRDISCWASRPLARTADQPGPRKRPPKPGTAGTNEVAGLQAPSSRSSISQRPNEAIERLAGLSGEVGDGGRRSAGAVRAIHGARLREGLRSVPPCSRRSRTSGHDQAWPATVRVPGSSGSSRTHARRRCAAKPRPRSLAARPRAGRARREGCPGCGAGSRSGHRSTDRSAGWHGERHEPRRPTLLRREAMEGAPCLEPARRGIAAIARVHGLTAVTRNGVGLRLQRGA